MTERSSRAEWLARTAALEETIRTLSQRSDTDRHLPPELVGALRDAGLFRMCVSQRLGGAGLNLPSLMAVTEALSYLDAATGWNVMIAAMQQSTVVRGLSEAAEAQLFDDGPDLIIAGSGAPLGSARRIEGGYVVSGRWPYASGCRQASWLIGGALVQQDDESPPARRAFIFKADQCEILDSWRTLGLRGTGSNDFQVTDVFVPEHLSLTASPTRRLGSNVFSQPMFQTIAPLQIAPVALGIARHAIDAFKAMAQTKTPFASQSPLASQHTTHERFGRAVALVRTGKAFLDEQSGHLQHLIDYEEELSEDDSMLARLAAAVAVENAVSAVDSLFTLAGTSATFEASELQHCFRDVHMVPAHFQVGASQIEMAGQFLLGFGLQVRR